MMPPTATLPAPSPTRRAIDRLPAHLRRFVVDQDGRVRVTTG